MLDGVGGLFVPTNREEGKEEKEERYRVFLDVQMKRMLFNRQRMKQNLSLEREKIDMDKEEK